MILFDIENFLNNLNDKISSFLERNSTNPIFWSLLAFAIFGIGCWGIQYFNKR